MAMLKHKIIDTFIRLTTILFSSSLQHWQIKKIWNYWRTFNQCVSHRLNSKWKVFRLTNSMAFLFHLTDVPLGCQYALLTHILSRYPLIKTFLCDCKKNVIMMISVCSVQLLSKKVGSDGLVASTKYLLSELLSKTGKDSKTFTGVLRSENHEVEQIVPVNLQVYSICCDEKENLIVKLSHQSANFFSATICLPQHDNHICRTKNIDKYLKKYRCCNCNKFLSRSINVQRY